MDKIASTMDRLGPGGSTNIGAGMSYALKILTERKYKNPVSSVLLLTDGCDDYG
jgi:Mg-chelatase subunit ChlD